VATAVDFCYGDTDGYGQRQPAVTLLASAEAASIRTIMGRFQAQPYASLDSEQQADSETTTASTVPVLLVRGKAWYLKRVALFVLLTGALAALVVGLRASDQGSVTVLAPSGCYGVLYNITNADAVSTSSELPNQLERLGRAVDHIYMLCAAACKRSAIERQIPDEWRPKVTLLNGHAYDECLGDQSRTHYTQATVSHQGAVLDAMQRGFRRVMILEEDNVWQPVKIPWTASEWHNTEQFINSSEWDLIRLGYNNYLVTTSCNAECLCRAQKGTRLCTTAAAQCDLRSSNAYLVSNSAMGRIVNASCQEDCVIDWQLFMQFKQTLFVPPLGWQDTQGGRRRLGQAINIVREHYRKFAQHCIPSCTKQPSSCLL
jgi:hypothetical protein